MYGETGGNIAGTGPCQLTALAEVEVTLFMCYDAGLFMRYDAGTGLH